MTDIVALTFNIRTGRGLDGRHSWWFRRHAAIDAIRGANPDVAGLQEVRLVQLGFLRSHLPEYRFLSVGRANGRRRGEHCPVLYRHNRFHVDQWEVRWYSENQSGRIATMARLVDADTNTPLGVVSTHLDHRSVERRTNSAAALATWLGSWDGPWIVLGDFNATVVEAGVAMLIAGGLKDALAHVPPRGPGAATAHGFTGRIDGRRIDHILVSPALDVVEAAIVRTTPRGRLPSDHWPVVALLRRRH